MPSGARVCSHCGALNASDEARCHRCAKPLPGPVALAVGDLLASVGGTERLVVKAVALGCAVVFLLSVVGKGEVPIWPGQSVRPSELIRWGALVGGLDVEEPWRHLAAVFVHANALHLFSNMLALASFGRAAEDALGPGRFAVAFVLTGVLGFVVSDVFYRVAGGGAPLTMGASGAVFGALGVYAGEAWGRRSPEWKGRVTWALGYAALVFALFGFGAGSRFSVNHAAHIGGLGAGLALGYAFGKERGAHRRDRVFNGIAAGLLVLSVASVVASNTSPAWHYFRQYDDLQGE